MLKSKSFITVDVGAGSLKLAEFESTENGALRLKNFGVKPLGLEGSLESKREAVTKRNLQAIISEASIASKQIMICAPGFHVFSKQSNPDYSV